VKPSEDFSLVKGGPFYKLLWLGREPDDAQALVRQRIIPVALFVWLPLLLLSALEGQALPRGSTTVPFLLDLEVHIRFLLTMPLLIAAEVPVHRRTRHVAAVFLERHLIPERDRARFDAAVQSTLRLRDSLLAEVLLVAFVYVVGILVFWRRYMALDTATWYATPTADGSTLSFAGMWYWYVSLPFFQFLLCRWYFRFVVWLGFLWRVSRIELSLIPTHPDRVGGLGTLANTVYGFALLAMAHGALVAGPLASRIFFLGAVLTEFRVQIAVVAMLVPCLVAGPLLLFSFQLGRTKRTGSREYGTLAERYVREFDAKWLRGGAPAGERLIGSQDIQALADLGHSYDLVRAMRISLVTKESLLQIALATFVPIAPLALTMMPWDEVLRAVVGVLF
jgi:hypothetical protein